MSPVEWDAQAYESVAAPQLAWGRRLLSTRSWRGDESVLDAGCGPGTLTAELLERIPQGRVTAFDVDPRMVERARQNLARHPHAAVVQGDLQSMALGETFDVIVSNAVLHWVPDHDAVFASFMRHLKPGGELLLQFGGEGNLERVRGVAREVMRGEAFASAFQDWSPPWHYEDDASTQERLLIAGFTHPEVSLEPAPTTFADEASYRRFGEAVVLGPYLQRIRSPQVRTAFVDEFMRRITASKQPLTYDYVRLNVRARRSPHH